MHKFLAGVCQDKSAPRYKDCSEKFSALIQPYEPKELLKMKNICYNVGVCSTKNIVSLERRQETAHEEIENCAICEAIVPIVSAMQDKVESKYDFGAKSSYYCSGIPNNKKKKVGDLIPKMSVASTFYICLQYLKLPKIHVSYS